jgi:hypothetical protein
MRAANRGPFFPNSRLQPLHRAIVIADPGVRHGDDVGVEPAFFPLRVVFTLSLEHWT